MFIFRQLGVYGAHKSKPSLVLMGMFSYFHIRHIRPISNRCHNGDNGVGECKLNNFCTNLKTHHMSHKPM